MRPGEFITSDTHFGHTNVISYSNRPFASVEEMDRELILRWNAKVTKNAIVYHLGDFAFSKPGRIHQILNQLNGRICLVRGNHDRFLKKSQDIVQRFEWVKDYYESKTPDGTKVVMCHYPFLIWNKRHYGSWSLHGHSHGSLRDEKIMRLDIGVDTNPNYEPYSYDEIAKKMKNRKITSIDHHKVR